MLEFIKQLFFRKIESESVSKPIQNCLNCFHSRDSHKSYFGECSVGTYYSERGQDKICYEGELWKSRIEVVN